MQQKPVNKLEMEESSDQARMLISKFQRKGFDGLTLEEVATAMITPDFGKQFQQMTGQDWSARYEIKAAERLSKSKFDIQWMARKGNDPHTPLFVNCAKGQLDKVRTYLKECKDSSIKTIVDQTKKSPLHIASQEGHLSIVELLLLNGFNPNARDRLLKTPLHYACQYGWDSVVDTLLKKGGDILAKDSLGRSTIHYAACGPSSLILQLLIATRPELVNDLDHKRRTPLHYCVWNSHQHQVDLLRTLLDFNSAPNALDIDLKTPIHHAAEGGMTRALPILLQRGGLDSMAIRDRSGKTPLELSLNDRTREILIVYSSTPLNHNQEDIQWMDQAIMGNKVVVQKPFYEDPRESKSPQTQAPLKGKLKQVKLQSSPQQELDEKQTLKGLNQQQQVDFSQPQQQQSWGPSSMNEWIREKFFTIMKKVQESGIKANHHLKKPYIYTGSWLEGINTMEELYESLKDITPGEVAMRIFNVLCPYDRPLPVKGQEEVVDGFYGEQWYDSSSFTGQKRAEEMEKAKRQMQQEYLNRITELETMCQLKEQSIMENDQELAKAKAQVEIIKKTFQDQEAKIQKEITALTEQVKIKDSTINAVKQDVKKLQKIIQEKDVEIQTWKNTPQGPSEEDIQQYVEEIEQLKNEIKQTNEKQKQLKFKSGQLFIKAINDAKDAANADAEQKIKEAQLLAQKKIAELDKRQVELDKRKAEIQAEVLPTNAVGGVENLQDDDSILNLFKALKGNPPGMQDRMKKCDADGDGKLTQQEFGQFLTNLKLTQQDIHSLNRIAGFLNQRKFLGIQEWIQILQDRPKQREEWEQKLFCKILDTLKAKNLTIDRFFELLDTDNSGSLSPVEMKQGLKSLKIVLNTQDMNNMFCIFDADKSGSIQLQEMKEILEHYDQLRKQQGLEEDIEWEGRIQDKDEGELNCSVVDIKDEVYDKQDGKEWVVQENDFNLLNGDLKIQIPKGGDLLGIKLLKVVVLKVILRGALNNEVIKQFTLFDATQEWNVAVLVPIRNILKENLCEHFIIQLYSSPDALNEESFLGDIHSQWKDCIDQPDKWAINNKFQLTNKTFIKEKSKMKSVTGYLNVQVRYSPSSSPKFTGQLVPLQETVSLIPSFQGTIVEEGSVEIVVVQAILSSENKNVKDAKYKCDVRFMDVDETDLLAQISANGNIFWDRKFLQDVKPVANVAIKSVYVKVYMETPKNMVFKNTKLFGEVYVNWNECILHPGEYLSTKSFLLQDHAAAPNQENKQQQQSIIQKLYLKIRYVPKSMFQSIVGFKAGVSEKDKKKQLTLEDMQEGTLKVLFVRAKNLRADDGDTSDPYCIVKYHSFDKVIKLQSKTIPKTVNPEWRDMQAIKVLAPREPPYPPLDIEVFDEDKLGDDSLGICKIDLGPAFEKPCSWAVNDFFPVNDPKFVQKDPKIFPQVYIQCYWVPTGVKDPNAKAKDKEDKIAGESDPNFTSGTLLVKIIHARELSGDSTPDPYVTVTFPGGIEQKTETLSSTINPVWNQLFKQVFKIPKDAQIPLKIFVKDSNYLSRDAVIGYTDVQWISVCTQKPGEWAINQVFKLSGTFESKGQLGSLGYIYLQVKFLENGMIDDNAEAPLVENLLEMISNKQGLYQGTLRVFLVHARDLVKADSGGLSDPYVKFKVPGGSLVETPARKSTINPSWKTIYPMKVAMPKDTIQPLRIEVFDDDLVGDELIGYASADLQKCFSAPTTWAFNEVIDLSGDINMQHKYKTQDFGKIYIQIMYCPQGIDNSDPPLPLTEDIDAVLREKEQENKKPMKGQLVINIPLALGVKSADSSTKTSDPYCEIHLPDQHKVSTKVIEKTTNPIWNFSYKWNCNIIKEQYVPIRIVILDSDAGAIDDKLGEFLVEWMECFKNPTQWEINKIFQLTGEQDMGEDLGSAYVQMQFLLEGQEKMPEGSRLPDTIAQLKNDYGRVVGTVLVKIVSATQLYSSDITGKSDPFVEAYLASDDSKKMKTKVVPDSLDPVWNFEGSLYIQLLRCQVKANTIRFDVKDDDTIGSDYLGSVDIDLIDILEKNPNSEMIGDYPLRNPEKKGSPNLGTLKVILVWQPDPFNEGVIGLREPQKTYTGELFIKFPNARQLPSGDPFLKFFITHDQNKIYDYKKQHIKSNQNPEFPYEEKIRFTEVNELNIKTLRATITVKNFNLLVDTTFGGITQNLTDIFYKPGTWINKYVQLYDDDGKKMESYLYILAQWRPDGAQIDTNLPQLIDFKAFINEGKPPTFSGKLKFTYIALKNIQSMDFTGASDPFVEIVLSKGSNKSFITSTQDDKTECFWKDPGEMIITDMTKESASITKMFITVYDYDYNSNDLIGKNEIDLSQILLQQNGWINQRLPLMDEKDFPEKCELYIQCQWLRDGAQPTPQPVNLYEEILQKQKEEEEKKKKEALEQAAVPKCPGKLRVFIIGCRNLIKADILDQSDPFAEIKISKGDKAILKTATIDNNSNPTWNFEGAFTLGLQQQEYVDMKLMITIYDYDPMAKNDFLGFVEVTLDDIFKAPGTWINKILLLKDEHGNDGKNGDIYILSQWIPDDAKNNISPGKPQQLAYGPIDPAAQLSSVAQATIIQGMFQLNVIKVSNYPEGKKAMAKVTFDNAKIVQGTNEIKTDLKQSGVSWNTKSSISLKVTDQDIQIVKLNIVLFDENNQQTATTEVDVTQLFTKPGQWINQYYSFKINNLKPNQNQQIYIQAQWRPSGQGQIDLTEPQLLPDPEVPAAAEVNKPSVVLQPRGKLKVAVIRAEKILLLDGGKSSNTIITVIYDGDKQSTPKVKGANPEYQLVLPAFNLKCADLSQVKPLNILVEHDPGFVYRKVEIGVQTIADFKEVFSNPNQWAFKQTILLADPKKQQNDNGSITLWIGFVPEKSQDNLLQAK